MPFVYVCVCVYPKMYFQRSSSHTYLFFELKPMCIWFAETSQRTSITPDLFPHQAFKYFWNRVPSQQGTQYVNSGWSEAETQGFQSEKVISSLRFEIKK